MATFQKLQFQANAMRRRLVEFSALDPEIVENIIQYAKSLIKPNGTEIDDNVFKAQMVDQFEITSQFMITNMIEALKQQDNSIVRMTKNKVSTIPLEDYCRLICTFLTNKLDIKIDWVFTAYDTNNDGSLSKLELYLLLKPCVLHSEDMDLEDAIKDLIDIVLTVVDFDKNGLVDLEEFRSLVKSNILYIDLLGQVLPQDHVVERFLHKIRNKTALEVAKSFQRERATSLAEAPLPPLPSYYPVDLELP